MAAAFTRLLALAVAAIWIATTAFAAGQVEDTEQAANGGMTFGNVCHVALMAFTDAELMADMMSNPEHVADLTVIVNDPQTAYLMANCSTDTTMWDTWVENGTNLKSLAAAAGTMMSPQTMIRWAMAPMNPKIWTSMMAHLNPEKYAKWSKAMASPAFYQPAVAMTEPAWWTERIGWAINPQSYAPVFSMFASVIKPATPPAQP